MGLRQVLGALAGREPPRPKPRGCQNCGFTFASEAAWTCHFEYEPGTRCLPSPRFAPLLTEVSGVWCLSGSDSARS